MVGNLQCDEQKKYAAENPVCSKSVIQNRRGHKGLPKQTKHWRNSSPLNQPYKGYAVSEMLQGPQSTKDITTSMKPTDITITLNPYISIITLNVNGLNVPTKRQRVSEWIKTKKKTKKKQDTSICWLQETHFRPEDTFRLKVRGWRTIYHATGSQKKAGVAILRQTRL